MSAPDADPTDPNPRPGTDPGTKPAKKAVKSGIPATSPAIKTTADVGELSKRVSRNHLAAASKVKQRSVVAW